MGSIDILTAYEDGSHELSDPDLLDRATALDRMLFSHDDDLLIEATWRQRHAIGFGGVIYARLADVSIGQCIQDLELIAHLGTDADTTNQVIYLPL